LDPSNWSCFVHFWLDSHGYPRILNSTCCEP
jgi:hypothetical protein